MSRRCLRWRQNVSLYHARKLQAVALLIISQRLRISFHPISVGRRNLLSRSLWWQAYAPRRDVLRQVSLALFAALEIAVALLLHAIVCWSVRSRYVATRWAFSSRMVSLSVITLNHLGWILRWLSFALASFFCRLQLADSCRVCIGNLMALAEWVAPFDSTVATARLLLLIEWSLHLATTCVHTWWHRSLINWFPSFIALVTVLLVRLIGTLRNWNNLIYLTMAYLVGDVQGDLRL